MGRPVESRMQKGELKVMKRGFRRITRLIEDARTIAICAHTNPDGDALGTQLALAQIIEQEWPQKEVTCLLADPAPCPRIYEFLPGTDRLVHASDYDVDPDLFICVDIAGGPRLNEALAVRDRAAQVAIIDHHPNDDPQADAWVICPEAAAAAVLVTRFAKHLGASISRECAQCLYCAIATDTGNFQYQNADPEAFAMASLLVDAGADPSEVSLNVYQSFRLEYLRLLATACDRIRTFMGGRLVYSYVTSADFERTGASLDECDGLVDTVRSVVGTEVVLFLKEVPGNKVRGNLRSKTSFDVSAIAQAMGGGGHKAAAGFMCDGTIDDAASKVLPLLRAAIEEHDAAQREQDAAGDEAGTEPEAAE